MEGFGPVFVAIEAALVLTTKLLRDEKHEAILKTGMFLYESEHMAG